MAKLKILGTEYELTTRKKEDDAALHSGLNGYCDYTSRSIVIVDYVSDKLDARELDDLDVLRRETLRHEILHAFAHESGLGYESKWAQDEECIDYFAKQMEKMIAVFLSAGALSSEAIVRMADIPSVIIPTTAFENNLVTVNCETPDAHLRKEVDPHEQ